MAYQFNVVKMLMQDFIKKDTLRKNNGLLGGVEQSAVDQTNVKRDLPGCSSLPAPKLTSHRN